MNPTPPTPDLLPCPFCGGPARLHELVQLVGSPKEFSVCCQNCVLCYPSSRLRPDAAIAAWNRRPESGKAPAAPALEIVDQEKGWDGLPVRVLVSSGKKREWYFRKGHPVAAQAVPGEAREADELEAEIRCHYTSSTDWEWMEHLLKVIDKLRNPHTVRAGT